MNVAYKIFTFTDFETVLQVSNKSLTLQRDCLLVLADTDPTGAPRTVSVTVFIPLLGL